MEASDPAGGGRGRMSPDSLVNGGGGVPRELLRARLARFPCRREGLYWHDSSLSRHRWHDGRPLSHFTLAAVHPSQASRSRT